jgi:hypothetical protein
MLQDFAPQPPIWPEGGMVYADMSQPPPVQIPSASGTTVKITFGKYKITVADRITLKPFNTKYKCVVPYTFSCNISKDLTPVFLEFQLL